MAKQLKKTELLSPDSRISIMRLYNGNANAFYARHLAKVMDLNTFYCAMRLDAITKDVAVLIEASIQEDLFLSGISEDTLSRMPDLETLIYLIDTKLKRDEDVTDLAEFIDLFTKMLHKKRIKLEGGKKSLLTTRINHHYWSKFLPDHLIDKEHLKQEEEAFKKELDESSYGGL